MGRPSHPRMIVAGTSSLDSFLEVNVECYYLECDTERAGTSLNFFPPLDPR